MNFVSRSFVTAQWGLQFSSRGVRPSASTMMARHLDQNTMGYLQWRWGSQSAMTTSIVRDTKTSHFTLALQVKPSQGYIDDGNLFHSKQSRSIKNAIHLFLFLFLSWAFLIPI